MKFKILLLINVCFVQLTNAQHPLTNTIDSIKAETFINNRITAKMFSDDLVTFSEPSFISVKYLDYTLNENAQKKPFVLHSDSKFPISIGGYRWNNPKTGLIFAMQIIPQVKIRIFDDDDKFNDSSFAVRTPSYIPTATFFITHKNFWKPNKTKYFAGFTAFHHSNGQDGNEFDINGNVNVYNGNFGEQVAFEFLIGSMFSEKLNLLKCEGKTDSKLQNYKLKYHYSDCEYIHFYKLGFEWHPKKLTNLTYLPYKIYGRFRWNAYYSLSSFSKENIKLINSNQNFITKNNQDIKIHEKWRLVFKLTYISDLKYNSGNIYNLSKIGMLDLGKRINFSSKYIRPFKSSENAACLLELGYSGSDEYNVYFQQSFWFLRFGVSFGFFNRN